MNQIAVTATITVSAAEVRDARLGSRSGRVDLMSRLALLAVESLAVQFDSLPRERIAIYLAASAGSLSTDVEYWSGRTATGGPSPTLFTYTLPSAAIGEIAIRHRLTGPNLCLVGGNHDLLLEATELIQGNEADGCVCVWAEVVSPALASLLSTTPAASAHAFFVRRVKPN